MNDKYFFGHCLCNHRNGLAAEDVAVMATRKKHVMVEVFKTNVAHAEQANMLLGEIHKVHKEYKANFDLDDCDSILRIKCLIGEVQAACVIRLLNQFGFRAEVLADEVNVLARYIG